MAGLTHALAILFAAIAGCGAVIAALGAAAVQRFAGQAKQAPSTRPPVTVLKPLCGDEPGLEHALASICGQRYPAFQVVFGVHDPADPALAAVVRARRRYPACDIAVVVDPALHGSNRKVGNLINMFPAARHDLLVFSDSDLHVAPDYLDRLIAALEGPNVGLVTALCTGLPTSPGAAAQLGATAISHSFLPGVLLSRALGRQDCLGTTMALRRDVLARAGGLEGLRGHLADDNVLAQRVQRIGLRVALAATVPMTAVPERTMREIWLHELRWARTIRSLEPCIFVASTLQFPLAWATAAIVLSGAAAWSLALFAAAWAVRAAAACLVDRMLRPAGGRAPVWLLPLRDALSVMEVAGSYLGRSVVWRGHTMRTDAAHRSDTAFEPSAAPDPGLV